MDIEFRWVVQHDGDKFLQFRRCNIEYETAPVTGYAVQKAVWTDWQDVPVVYE
jgi:hypothetical protein